MGEFYKSVCHVTYNRHGLKKSVYYEMGSFFLPLA